MKKIVSIFMVFIMLFMLIFNVSSQGADVDINASVLDYYYGGSDVDIDPSDFEVIKTYNISELTGKYKTQGRTSIVDNALMLDYSASGLEFNAYCSGTVSISFEVSDLIEDELGGIYFTVIVDDITQDRTMCHVTQTGITKMTLAEDLSSGYHNFKIYRQTELSCGTVGVSSISLKGVLISPPNDNELFIEFIGDSITTGYGNLAKDSDIDASVANKPIYQDATKGFAYLTAQALNMDFSLVASSGIGASVGQTGSMQEMYVKQRYSKDDTEYNFAKQPNFIVIGLGTNDYDTYEANGLTEADVIQGFKDMLTLARAKNPNAKIIWIYNMMHDWANDAIVQIINEAGGSKNGYYSLELTQDNSGGNEHPYYTAHEVMAEELVQFISDNFYWNNKTGNFTQFIGNAIRNTTSKGEQGLRFKYQFDTAEGSDYTKVQEQYTVKQIGVLAIKNVYLNNEELVANTSYSGRSPSCGIFFDKDNNINKLTDDNIASAVLYNIGYNKSTGTVDFSAYAYAYTARCYMILNDGYNDFYVYDENEYSSSVFTVMRKIIEEFSSQTTPPDESSQLFNDYGAVQTILNNNTLLDKNNKTISDHFTAKQTYVANEITFNSTTEYENPVYDVEVDVSFTNQDTGTLIKVPAFWNGGTEWKVRYALTEPGTWEYKTSCTDDTENEGLHNISGSLFCVEYSGSLDIYKKGFLTVEDGNRYLSYANGEPFFYLGDTHWSLPMESLTDPKGNEYTNVGSNYTYGALTDAEMAALKEKYSALDKDTTGLGTKPQFEFVMDYRASQGFTVIQSQQLDIFGSGHKGNSWMADNEGNIFTYGVNDFILEKFKTLDKYFAYIAELGFVHANTQFSYPEELIKEYRHNTITDEQLKKLCRYWVARYSAYPVIWTTAQECDDNYGNYHNKDLINNSDGTEGSDGLVDGCTHSTVCQFDENLHNPWYDVMEYIAEYDPYNHPNTAHQESITGVVATDDGSTARAESIFDDSEHYDLYAAQLQGFKLDGDPWYGNKIFGVTSEYWEFLKNYWNNPKSKPVVCYEGSYDQFACSSLRGRGQGWMSFLNGIYGYGYGVQPFFNIYWGLGMGPYKDADNPNKNYYYNEDMNWVDGVYAEAAEDMTVMKKFLTETLYDTYGVNWWELIPCFDDSSYYSKPYDTTGDGTYENCYSVATVDKNSDGTIDMYIGYFAGEETIDMGVLNGMKKNSKYNYSWYDVGTGELVETYTVNTRGNTTRPVGYTNDTIYFWNQVPGEKPISNSTSKYTDMLLIVTPAS